MCFSHRSPRAYISLSSIPRGLFTVYQISSSHVSPLERQHDCPLPIVFQMQCLYIGRDSDPTFRTRQVYPPLYSHHCSCDCLTVHTCPSLAVGWGGRDGDTSDQGGGDRGRAELAQILANFFITALKARILTRPLSTWEPGLEAGGSLPQAGSVFKVLYFIC